MRGRRTTVLAGIGLELGAAVVLVLQHVQGAPPAAARRTPASTLDAVAVGQPVRVTSGVPRSSFLPLGTAPRDDRTLSAQHAYDLLVSGSAKLSPIPASVRPYYGVLTDPSASPGSVHVRVWGFAVESDCGRAGVQPSEASPSPRRTPCRLWEFVDAMTGRLLGEVARQLSPDPKGG
jgi:hypothetical protein